MSVSLEPDQRQMWRIFPDLVIDRVHLEAGPDTISKPPKMLLIIYHTAHTKF